MVCPFALLRGYSLSRYVPDVEVKVYKEYEQFWGKKID
jgi:hypothetical protein